MMNRYQCEKIIHNNHGETLVEVMVAFIVLMIVIATFTGCITSTSAAINYSTDIRRTSDLEYSNLHSFMADENDTSWNGIVSRTSIKEVTTTPSDPANPSASSITLEAYQYKSGDSVYWVFK